MFANHVLCASYHRNIGVSWYKTTVFGSDYNKGNYCLICFTLLMYTPNTISTFTLGIHIFQECSNEHSDPWCVWKVYKGSVRQSRSECITFLICKLHIWCSFRSKLAMKTWEVVHVAVEFMLLVGRGSEFLIRKSGWRLFVFDTEENSSVRLVGRMFFCEVEKGEYWGH